MLLLLLLLSHFSRVGLCATPQTAANQGPPSLGFSRQEYRNGMPLLHYTIVLLLLLLLFFMLSFSDEPLKASN